jgi:hypothetical protein
MAIHLGRRWFARTTQLVDHPIVSSRSPLNASTIDNICIYICFALEYLHFTCLIDLKLTSIQQHYELVCMHTLPTSIHRNEFPTTVFTRCQSQLVTLSVTCSLIHRHISPTTTELSKDSSDLLNMSFYTVQQGQTLEATPRPIVWSPTSTSCDTGPVQHAQTTCRSLRWCESQLNCILSTKYDVPPRVLCHACAEIRYESRVLQKHRRSINSTTQVPANTSSFKCTVLCHPR